MGIRFACHACNKQLNIKESLAGKRGKCPRCGVRFRIPTEDREFSLRLHEPSGRPGAEDDGSGQESDSASFAEEESPGTAAPETAAPETAAPGTAAPVTAAPGTAAPRTAATAAASQPLTAPESLAAPQPPSPAEEPADPPFDPLADPLAQWYVRPSSGGQYGPADGPTVRQWIAEQRLTADTLLWRDGWPEWRAAGEVLGETFAPPLRNASSPGASSSGASSSGASSVGTSSVGASPGEASSVGGGSVGSSSVGSSSVGSSSVGSSSVGGGSGIRESATADPVSASPAAGSPSSADSSTLHAAKSKTAMRAGRPASGEPASQTATAPPTPTTAQDSPGRLPRAGRQDSFRNDTLSSPLATSTASGPAGIDAPLESPAADLSPASAAETYLGARRRRKQRQRAVLIGVLVAASLLLIVALVVALLGGPINAPPAAS